MGGGARRISSVMASPTHADRIRLVRDKESGIEALEARFAAHAYDLHRHEEWLVGVTGHGMLISELEARVRRMEKHLDLPPIGAI